MAKQPDRVAQLMLASAELMRAEFQAHEIVQHAGVRGDWREKTIQAFIDRHLPGHIQTVHRGEIITVDGHYSNECDIVISDRAVRPLMGGSEGSVIFNECVYGVVEVKTSLTKKRALETFNKLGRAKELGKSAYRPNAPRQLYKAYGRDWDHFPTASVLFAFSGPKIETVTSYLRDWKKDNPCGRWPDSIFVLGQGFICWRDAATGLISSSPDPESEVWWFEVSPVVDVLLPFALTINTLFSHASMTPLSLAAYAQKIPITGSRWGLME
jgi:hypothetical protein